MVEGRGRNDFKKKWGKSGELPSLWGPGRGGRELKSMGFYFIIFFLDLSFVGVVMTNIFKKK